MDLTTKPSSSKNVETTEKKDDEKRAKQERKEKVYHRSHCISEREKTDLTTKPRSSKDVETIEKKDDEKQAKQERKEELKAYHRSLCISEREKLRNLDKIRLRRFPLYIQNSATRTAIITIKAIFNANMTYNDILECVSVPSWTNPNATDILITFINENRRNYIYNMRTRENRGYRMICDELGEERLAVWQKLVQKYGIYRVYTHCGGVMLDLKDGKWKRFLSLRQLKKFEDSQDKN